MYSLKVHTSHATTQVMIGESFKNVEKYLPKIKQIIVITDRHVRQHYGDFLQQWPIIEIGIGEESKTIRTLEDIYRGLLAKDADRNSFVLAVGGGIVCDVAGYAASTYMRGIPFGFISTTLLSQVDASVGGKNGVNFGGYKNMIGTFNQPQFVICDTTMLQTLPVTEFISGFAEIAKAAMIRSYELFQYLEQHASEALARRNDVLLHLVQESVKIKAAVVENDEREHGERRILNFGHTFGHAVEMLGRMNHGEAVSIGMMIAVRWSIGECGLSQVEANRIKQLLCTLQLPVTTNIPVDDIIQTALKDKKRDGDSIHLVLLSQIGKTDVVQTPIDAICAKLPQYFC